MSITGEDVKYIRETAGYSMLEARAAAALLNHMGIDIYSDEAAALMHRNYFVYKIARYANYLKIKELVDEFGPF